MAQDMQQVKPGAPSRPGQAARRRLSRRGATPPVMRPALVGLGFALVLVVIEGLLWILNPLNLFGRASSHTLPALLSLVAHTPILLLIFLLEFVVAITLALLFTRPLAFRRYCREALKAGERYRVTYTSLPNWPSIYDTTVSYYQYTPDPAMPLLVRERSLLDLVRGSPFSSEPRSHLTLLGEAGSGKTTALYCYQFYALLRRRNILFGREKVPVYIPLRQYALYLRALAPSSQGNPAPANAARLLDFLYHSDLPGMHHLRPYLSRLASQGRLLLLCDGLHDIEESDRPGVVAELADLMSQDRNRVILTCRPIDLRQQPALAEAIEANVVPRAYLRPLTTEQVRTIVESYIESDSAGRKWKHTAGQIMDIIARTRLQTCCDTPLLLLALLSVIDGMGMERGRRLDTRGRLLRASISQRITQTQRQAAWQGHAPDEKEVLLFLGELACAARWTSITSAIQLHEQPHLFGDWLPSFEHHAGALHDWLEASAGKLFLEESLHNPYSREDIARLLRFAQDAALIEISPHGFLSFRHELIADYAIAEYFFALQPAVDTTLQKTRFAGLLTQAFKLADSSDAFSRWSVPVTLWAGLLDDPAAYAGRLVEHAQSYPAARLEALSLSLLCLGVAAYPPRLSSSPTAAPAGLEALFQKGAQDQEQRAALAHLFSRHAAEGAYEIYQALFTLLMVPGIDEFVALLDGETVASLLVNRLVEIVDDVEYEGQVKRLVRITGMLGAAAVPLAAALSKPAAGHSSRLRTAAINILGGTGDAGAVASLHACLYDADSFIANRAASALYRLGPTLALPALIGELGNTAQTTATLPVHLMTLRILDRFLDDDEPARRLKPAQRQQVMTTLMNILNQPYAPEVQEAAREILVRQGQAAEEGSGGEMAVEALIQNLAASDEQLARMAISALYEIGPAATPLLLRHLQQKPPELVMARIVATLGMIRDPRALPALLRLLATPSLEVQQQVAQALRRYGDESIPGLIYQVLQGGSEQVATAAAQILGEMGESAIDPVTEALVPIVPGRTHRLVQVLARLPSPQSVPPLVALLESSTQEAAVDTQLVLALIEALGQFQDRRVVAPLMEMLASASPLFYEGAITALSNLGSLACPALVAGLDVLQESAITQRIERALLGMAHFPGDCLLDALASGSEAQAGHVMHVFIASGLEAARVVVRNLLHPSRRVQLSMHEAAERMPGRVIVPALLEAIDHPDQEMRAVVAEYLLKHPDEAIPPLVEMLEEDEQGGLAQRLLLDFGPAILPALVPALDSVSDLAYQRARQLVVELARQSPQELRQVILLFTLSLPPRAREALVETLAGDLADISVPALLDGLADAHLIGAASETLARMVNRRDARSPLILDELLAALRNDVLRQGAEIALVGIGAEAVPAVGSLITDPDPQIARTAQDILCQIGVPAFAFIWAAHSDVTNRPRREAARAIFRRMPTVVIKDELVQLLSSDKPEDISMALALLLERIHDESLQADREHEMIPTLLEYVQTHPQELAGHRVLALLLLIGGRTIVDFITQVLYEYPNHQDVLLYSLLLLGEEAEEALLEILHDGGASMLLRAEAAGMLGLLAPHVDIREYARMLPEYGLWAGQSQGQHGVLQPDHLNLSLRALGGLLAGGHWDTDELDTLRVHSKKDSAEHELYAILLGWRYYPYIASLEQELANEREEHKRRVTLLSQEIVNVRTEKSELEEQLKGLQQAHDKRGKELDEAEQAATDWQQKHARTSQEKNQLQQTVQKLRSENLSLHEQLQEMTQEKQRLAARLTRLEQDLRSISGLGGQEKKR
jgi:HEAT repeat protein